MHRPPSCLVHSDRLVGIVPQPHCAQSARSNTRVGACVDRTDQDALSQNVVSQCGL